MHPVLLNIGGFELHSYGAIGSIAFLVLAWYVLRQASAAGWDREALVDVIFWGAMAGIVGARALFVLQNYAQLDGPMSWIDIRQGGMVFYGAPLVGLPVAFAVLVRKKLPFWQVMDVIAVALPLAHGMSRVGCFFAGCCFGTHSDLPWSVVFPEGGAAPHGVSLHPTQLYEATGLMMLSAFLSRKLHRPHFNGQVFLLYLGLYGVLRITTELVRGDVERGFLFESVLGETLSTSQGISLGMFVVVAVLWAVLGRRKPAEAL